MKLNQLAWARSCPSRLPSPHSISLPTQPTKPTNNRSGVAKRNYGEEAYYKLSASYFKQEFYLDTFLG